MVAPTEQLSNIPCLTFMYTGHSLRDKHFQYILLILFKNIINPVLMDVQLSV